MTVLQEAGLRQTMQHVVCTAEHRAASADKCKACTHACMQAWTAQRPNTHAQAWPHPLAPWMLSMMVRPWGQQAGGAAQPSWVAAKWPGASLAAWQLGQQVVLPQRTFWEAGCSAMGVSRLSCGQTGASALEQVSPGERAA